MRELLPFSVEDVGKHNQRDDGWLIVDDWVIDVSEFYDIHPGGMPVLIDWLGKDATKIFRDPASHSHSAAASDLISMFRVGYIKGKKTPEQVQSAAARGKTADDFGVDLSKGLLSQAASLGENYQSFITSVLILHSESLRYFDNDFLEYFSRSSWTMVPIVWVPVFFIMMFTAVNFFGLAPSFVPFYMFVGPFAWALVEYILHKYLFHMKTTSYAMNWIHFMLHGYHHIAPMDRGRLTFPPVPAMVLCSCVLACFLILLPVSHAVGLMAGVIIGYIIYDLAHYYLHHAPPKYLYLKWLKTHHLYHHYKNHDSNFGISNPVFDWVFSSFDSQVSAKKAKPN